MDRIRSDYLSSFLFNIEEFHMARKAADGVQEPVKKTRAYHSPRRKEQTNVTKARIVAAAMQLMKEKGYADMTLEAIAREAGVAPQTVYAVCGSKKGVLAAILETTVEAKRYDKLRDSIPQIMTGKERVKEIGHFTALLMEDAMPVFDIIRGMSVLSPEFAEQERDQSLMLLEKCRKSVHKMAEDGMLRPGLSEERATELYWSITTPGMHRRLTKVLNWTPEEYAAWISYLIGVTLLDWDSPMPFLNEEPRAARRAPVAVKKPARRTTRKKAGEEASAEAEAAAAGETEEQD